MILPPWMILIPAEMKRKGMRKVWTQSWHRIHPRLVLRNLLSHLTHRKELMSPLHQIQTRRPLCQPSSVYKSCQLSRVILVGTKLVKRKEKKVEQLILPTLGRILCSPLVTMFFWLLLAQDCSLLVFSQGPRWILYPFRLPVFFRVLEEVFLVKLMCMRRSITRFFLHEQTFCKYVFVS